MSKKDLWAVARITHEDIDGYYMAARTENIFYSESFDAAVDFMINVAIYNYVIEVGRLLDDTIVNKYTVWRLYDHCKANIVKNILNSFSRSVFEFYAYEEQEYHIVHLQMDTNYAAFC